MKPIDFLVILFWILCLTSAQGDSPPYHPGPLPPYDQPPTEHSRSSGRSAPPRKSERQAAYSRTRNYRRKDPKRHVNRRTGKHGKNRHRQKHWLFW